MSKSRSCHLAKRLTAFLLAFCCVFSLVPTSFAADSDELAPGETEELRYRYVWLISHPDLQLKIMKKDGEKSYTSKTSQCPVRKAQTIQCDTPP